MDASAVITLAAVIGLVWGGLAFFLTRAMKYEKIKRTNGEK